MKEKDFISQQIKAGYKIHFQQGVWWEKAAPFFYKPVLPFQEILRGKSKPKLAVSFLGYSHCVPEGSYANKVWSVMVLRNEKLKNFSIYNLSANRRKLVRKGLRRVEIKKIENIYFVVDDIRDICISSADRTSHGKPPNYYIKHYNEWKSFITKLFNLPNREWWGAFHQGKLIAYFYAYQISHTMYVNTHKSHSQFLGKKPNDALFFAFIDYCKRLPDCTELSLGDWNKDNPGINEFKMKYGFKKVDLPVYADYNPLVRLAIKYFRNHST